MNRRKNSISRLLPSTSVTRFGKESEKGKEPPVVSPLMQLPRRRTSTVRVAPNEDSHAAGFEQHSPTSPPSTPTSASAMFLRMTSQAGLRSLDTSSNTSLRSTSQSSPKLAGSPLQPKRSFRSKAPKPLKLDEKTVAFYPEQPFGSWETATSSYEEQFRRRRGDLLHRLGPSVPYMQAYNPTSLQCDALTTRLLEYICEPGTPCFYKFKNRGAVTAVLDLGCGPQLRWIMTAARFWPNAKIIGVDCVRPNPDIQIPSNVEFVQQNFLNPLLTIKTESVDFVRVSCLGTSIPEADWPVVLTEVRRILKTGGVIEVIDDERIRVYPEYFPEEHEVLDPKRRFSRASIEIEDRKDGLHPVDRYFRQMLVKRYGMSETPHRTIDTAMEIVFGANDRKHFRVEVPAPSFKLVETEETRRNGNLFQAFRAKKDAAQSAHHDNAAKAQRVLGLDTAAVGEKIGDPFLIFYPHGLCRLDASEVRMAACGTMHRVLSCRASLIDFIVGSSAEGEELDEVTKMLWEYEDFYRRLLDLRDDDDWNDFCGGRNEGKETPTAYRTSSDSCDSGYSSFQPSAPSKVARGKKQSRSITSDSNDCTLVRCFRIFHATKV